MMSWSMRVPQQWARLRADVCRRPSKCSSVGGAAKIAMMMGALAAAGAVMGAQEGVRG